MQFDLGTAIVAGIAGTAAMTLLMYMASLMNMRMDMPMMLGTMILSKGPAAWAIGLMMHLMMGVIFFLIYAAIFDVLSIRTNVVAWAALIGVAHGAMAGLAMGMIPAMHPRMAMAGGPSDDLVSNPGIFATSFGGTGPIAILMLHAVFGIVGAIVYTA